MEPLEWIVLGIGLVVGGLFGSRGKEIVRGAAKASMVVGEKARVMTANLREDFRDAIEEARYEQEQEEAHKEQAEYDAEVAHSATNAAPRSKARKSGSTPEGAVEHS